MFAERCARMWRCLSRQISFEHDGLLRPLYLPCLFSCTGSPTAAVPGYFADPLQRCQPVPSAKPRSSSKFCICSFQASCIVLRWFHASLPYSRRNIVRHLIRVPSFSAIDIHASEDIRHVSGPISGVVVQFPTDFMAQ